MSCRWLRKEPLSVVGYQCGFFGPCEYLHLKDFPCPCIEYARAFEEAKRGIDRRFATTTTTTTTTEYDPDRTHSLTMDGEV